MIVENGVAKQLEENECLAKKIVFPNGVLDFDKKIFTQNSVVEEVEIPNGFETIKKGAFFGLKNLKKVSLPESLKSIEQRAFANCVGLKEMNIPKNVTQIGAEAFFSCGELLFVNIPNSVVALGPSCFECCKSLQSFDMPNSVELIYQNAFQNCENLRYVKLSSNIDEIPENIFKGCASLKKINIPENVKFIGASSFENCKNLKQINIPNGVQVVSYRTFSKCKSLKEIVLPESIEIVDTGAFLLCSSLEKINLPQGIKEIGDEAFCGCENLKTLEIPFDAKFASDTFYGCGFKRIYFDTKNEKIILTKQTDAELEKECLGRAFDFDSVEQQVEFSDNFKQNNVAVLELFKSGKAKFIPPNYVLSTMPNVAIKDFFVNGNDRRWGKLVKLCKFDLLDEFDKDNVLPDFFKLYYALGGFSDNQGQSEKAFDYILDYVVDIKNKNAVENGQFVHKKFSKLSLTEKFNPEFALFFMKYYKQNPDFMFSEQLNVDLLCKLHNQFSQVQKNFPNMCVNTRKNIDRFTPEFMIEHCQMSFYENVEQGNEQLAELVGKYGYNQQQFNKIQEIFNKAKQVKQAFVLCADKTAKQGFVKFRLLEKDDPLGFVLGDVTNCCQHIGGAAEKCVEDGYVNPNSGFLVFEESALDKNGEKTNKIRVLGQAYIWYDKETKTVCYDNIEIPRFVLQKIKNGKDNLNADVFLTAVELSADAILTEMRKRGIDVERVTVGKGYNEFSSVLEQKFKLETFPKAKNKEGIYSDAKVGQFIIKEISERHKDDRQDTQDTNEKQDKQHKDSDLLPTTA